MENFTLESPLRPSALEALIAANSLATSRSATKTQRIHVFVLSIMQVDDEWKATIRVVIEPSGEILEPADEKKAELPPKDNNVTTELKTEEEMDIYDLLTGSYVLSAENNSALDIHFYMHPREADKDNWETVLPGMYPEYHYHFIESGSLWDVSQKIFPAIDFSLAVEGQYEKENSFSIDPKFKKNPYILELTEEL